jgi:MYND finger
VRHRCQSQQTCEPCLTRAAAQDKACCFHCGKLAPSMAACQRCTYARFCSKACQQAAWPGHKASCKKMAAAWQKPVAVKGMIDEDQNHLAFLADVLRDCCCKTS